MESRDTSGSTGQLSSSGSTGGGMHHSQSTPAGVDGGARTPPTTPKKGGKMLAIRVQMLDDTITIFQVQAKAMGKVLFEQVCKQLHLLEADYFGLEYQDLAGTRYWLDLQKPISRQLGLSLVDPLLNFCVKFYTPDPGQLEEEYTRYLYCLQVKRDLSQGLMHCNDNTAALMASYIVQAECGDYVSEDYPDHTYLSSYKFVPHQDQEMERKIMENHKKHAGQSPAEADLNLLETARRCELYGIKMHPAKDHENVPLNLAVAHMGIVVYQQITKINTFSWAKIRKLSFKRKKFLIKLHPEGFGYYKDTVEFFFEGRNECKNFWKKCVENHGFFRCSSVKNVSRHKTRVLSRGSSFRYSGKTQKQIVEFVRDNYVKRQTFQRSASFRHSSAHSSANNMHTSSVGNSISAHPLLPLADTNLSVEVSKLSASLGAMGVGSEEPISPTTRSACLPRVTPTSWSSAPDTRPTTLPARMTNSPSPPLTTQSGSPVTSATTSPQHIPYESNTHSSPVAVHAAVHRADTGTIISTTRTPSNRPPSQTQSQNDLDNTYIRPDPLPKRHIWQRSASCRDLYDFSFEDSGQAKRRIKPPESTRIKIDDRKLESPVTRYDDHRAIYAASQNPSLEIHQDIMMPDQKVYSSSYPGTTSYSQESVEDPGNYELRDSQDDLSHDSYELLERSDDDYSTSGDYKYTNAKTKSINTRSCSLDSGNYLPSDTDSDIDKRNKCRSSNDVHQDIFLMEDPRDFPREIIPRKSDGSYYKTFKSSSRTSSVESKSEYYEPKVIKPPKDTSRKIKRGLSSRTSSQESKSDYDTAKVTARRKSNGSITKKPSYESRTSSLESKSEYFDANSETKVKYQHDYDRKIQFERNYGMQKCKENAFKETSHVHSISLQNVETEQNIRANRMASLDQNTIPRTQKSAQLKSQSSLENDKKITHIWPESIAGVPTQINDWTTKQQSTRSTESESNVFSFDEDKIQSLQESDDPGYAVVPNIDFRSDSKKNYRDIFVEIEPRKLDLTKDPLMLHQPIERTKSDPNNLAWQRLNSNSRRMLLRHQKSIDLTPAESSDEDYLYKQIPSAPPIMKFRGSHFEMPTAEFGHFDILKREIQGEKTKFEVPKRQFESLGVKTQSDFVNLPPKSDADIPYVLHKRHAMNGTSKEDNKDVIKKSHEVPEIVEEKKKTPKSPIIMEPETTQFLFTQNIDLSKIDPVTLEVDKSSKPIQHMTSPKRDITKIDPALLETLNSKLSQIESDSPTSSKTESLKPQMKQKIIQQTIEEAKVEEKKISPEKPENKPIKIKPKRVIKPRMQPGKKGKNNKTKVRITSFSSDDESLDSDDVFGSAEATPTKLEFSPPQMRKEMESILKYESERKYLQYTMSSTEVEGSPPTTRKTDALYDRTLDPNHQTELRRISERSLSIPSSEDDFNIKTSDLQPVFEPETDDITLTLETLEEVDKEIDKSVDDTAEQITVQELLKEEDIKEMDEEREKEKIKLNEDIEMDIKDLKVPTKTTITEICSPSMRKKGQSPLLFAHARLNLSEGSAFSLLQKQQALESPLSGRRAKSLDAPIVPVCRLPPLNSFSSKDDTVEEEDHLKLKESDKELTEEELPVDEVKEIPVEPKKTIAPKVPEKKSLVVVKQKSAEKDQIVPDVTNKPKRVQKPIHGKSIPPKISAPKPKITTKDMKMKEKPSKPTTITAKTSIPPKVSTAVKPAGVQKIVQKPPIQKPITKPIRALPPKTLSLDRADRKTVDKTVTNQKTLPTQKSLPTQNSLQLPEIKRTKSQELESCKKPTPKEKARSLEKLEFKRTISKERTKSQEESDTDIAKRQEYQQMLYETAMKQTKAVKSPVKDILPVFPQVEEMVRERGGKLEISINTIENTSVNLEEAIIITKSPKKLDKKLLDQKLTKSLEIALSDDVTEKSLQRLGKSLDLDTREEKPENLEFDFKTEAIDNMRKEGIEDEVKVDDSSVDTLDTDTEETLQETESTHLILEGTSLDVWISVDDKPKEEDPKLKDITVVEKSSDFFEQVTLTKPPDLAKIDTKSSSDSQSMEKLSLGNSLEMKYIDESGDSSQRSDTQHIQELRRASKTVEKLLLRKLEKRKALAAQDSTPDIIPERLEEIEEVEHTLVRITSEEESLTEVSDLKCEGRQQDENLLGVNYAHKDALMKLSIERSKSEDTGSWMTVDCEEYVGNASFEDEQAPLESPEKDSPDKDIKEYKEDNLNLLTAHNKSNLLKLSSDQSRSSDTTGSWTSGEKDLSPGKTGEESSLSCSIGRAIGLSQTIEKFASKDQLDKMSPDLDVPRSPRSPRICVLGRAFTIDEYSACLKEKSESSSDEAPGDLPVDLQTIHESDTNDDEAGKLKFENRVSTSGRTFKIDEHSNIVKETPVPNSDDLALDLSADLKTVEPSKDKLHKAIQEAGILTMEHIPQNTRICVLGRTFNIDEYSNVVEEKSESNDLPLELPLDFQTIQQSKDQLNKMSPDLDAPRSPRSPRICVLGRAFTIDEYSACLKDKSESSSEEAPLDLPVDLQTIQASDTNDDDAAKLIKKPYPFEEKWSNDSELSQRLHKKITKKLSSSDKNSFSSIEDSLSERKKNGKGSLHSVDRLSAESRNSLDTESSSGSLGLAARIQKGGNEGGGLVESSCTWKRFPLESGSASSSLEEIGPDQDLYGQEYFLSRENSADVAGLDVYKYDPDITPTQDIIDDDLDKYNYPLGGITADLVGYGTSFLSRTLSRISERSTNSEKTSVDEDSTKASTHSDSLNDESLSMEQQVSLSSDPPSNAHGSEAEKKSETRNKKSSSKQSERIILEQVPNISNLLQRQISDDRRTSAEMADLSIDDIEIITSERGLKLRRQDSDDTIIDEDIELKEKEHSSSQESEEWPLPEIPQKPLMALHETPSSDNSQLTTQLYQPPKANIPKVFGLRGSLKSQESEQWPSPPSSLHEPRIVGNVETHYIMPPEEACKVVVDSNSTYDNDSNSISDNDNKLDYDGEKSHTYENVATDQISESISESLSIGPSGIKIVLENKSGDSGSNSDELNISNLNDDVFTEAVVDSKNELRPPTVMRRSTNSDDSDKKDRESHSSYSEEDATSSMGTTLEDGTVRYAFKPTKCTHSSHSEDTSIALSLSEWSNSTTTVKFQNLSSNSGKSSGLKSDDNSLTDIAHSISEWSSSNNSNTIKAQSLQFQKLSSSTGDSSTLTEMLPTMSEWSSSDSKTLVAQKFFPPTIQERPSITRMGSSFDDADNEPQSLKSPKNILSEDVVSSTTREVKFSLKSTERPVMIPLPILSDEKSTESSSMEQKTVHTQRYDKEKQKYQKHQSFKSSSTERPVKVPLKLTKCSPYYSSSLSSESTPLGASASISKTATIPLTRTHKKGVFHARSPPSENDSTSSMESPKCKSETRDRRGYRRRKHTPQKRHRTSKDDYFYADPEVCEYNEYIRNRSLEELPFRCYETETTPYAENLEEGYYPDGDSQSGSDIFRMEREEEDRFEPEGFDVSSIPPPLIEDDFEMEHRPDQI